MNIYNMKPAWLAVVEETKAELNRELTSEEVVKIWWDTKKYAETLGSMYSQYLGLEGQAKDEQVRGLISTLVMDGITSSNI